MAKENISKKIVDNEEKNISLINYQEREVLRITDWENYGNVQYIEFSYDEGKRLFEILKELYEEGLKTTE